MPGYDAHLPFPLRTLAVGARPVPLAGWLEPAGPDELVAKVADLDAHPLETVRTLPGSEPAQAELAALVGAPEPTLAAAARVVVDDLVLVDGVDLRVVAGAVAHPNRWRLETKLGATVAAVHDPVPGYAGGLAHAVDRLLRALRPGRPLERRNWSVLDDPTLFQPGDTAGMPTSFDPSGLWLRSERQAVLRLPATDAVVFAIRTRQWRLDGLAAHPAQAAGLAAAVRASPQALTAYKGLTAIGPALLAWLDDVAG